MFSIFVIVTYSDHLYFINITNISYRTYLLLQYCGRFCVMELQFSAGLVHAALNINDVTDIS